MGRDLPVTTTLICPVAGLARVQLLLYAIPKSGDSGYSKIRGGQSSCEELSVDQFLMIGFSKLLSLLPWKNFRRFSKDESQNQFLVYPVAERPGRRQAGQPGLSGTG